MIKLSDVAAKANVSITTVSMALSGKGRISSEMREKVMTAADELGYIRKKRSTTESSWGILLPMGENWDAIWHFIRPIVDNIVLTAKNKDFSYCIIPVYPDQETGDIKSSISKHKLTSIFSIHFGDPDLFEILEQEGIPVVVINNSQFQEGYYSICVDDFQGAYEGTRHLLEKNHRAISFLDYPRGMVPNIAYDRYFGFLKAMEEEGISLPKHWKITVDLNDTTEMKNQIGRVLENKDAPTAFFVHDDFMANRLIHLLNTMGKSVPEDISIIAPGDTLNYIHPETPRISTMSINTGLMGKYAADMMLERANGGY
ncbi:MAG: LacI family DNA-binding transcriptional regulator [Spirochaetales bacterium]|nr:LacI family DNA-binding transcriptional regulator [Spirochaetales bacterium]